MASYAIPTLGGTFQVGEKVAKINGFRGARLTRRGRFLSRAAVIASLLVLIASGYSAFSGASAESEKNVSTHLEVIVVAPGESLWSIAKLVGGDTDETVARILELNALSSPSLEAGTRLIIPTRS
jgi:hypothetical protein